jgi:hypothetical protein
VKADIEAILTLPEGPSRTARLAHWVQSLYAKGSRPVLVGGSAVELYTMGAYTSGDLDFAGEVPPGVRAALEAVGFTKKGRHWIHERGRVLLEFPGTRPHSVESLREIRTAGARVLVLAPEDLVVDRLSAWKFWRSEVDAVNALLLWRSSTIAIDRRRLRRLAKSAEVEDALSELERFARRHRHETPPAAELLEWSRTTFR